MKNKRLREEPIRLISVYLENWKGQLLDNCLRKAKQNLISWVKEASKNEQAVLLRVKYSSMGERIHKGMLKGSGPRWGWKHERSNWVCYYSGVGFSALPSLPIKHISYTSKMLALICPRSFECRPYFYLRVHSV